MLISFSEISNPLGDDRFASMFTNLDFQVEIESEEYKLRYPVVSKQEKKRRLRDADENDDQMGVMDSGSDDDMTGVWEEVKAVRKEFNQKKSREKHRHEERDAKKQDVKMFSLKDDFELSNLKKTANKSVSMGEMLQNDTGNNIVQESGTALGSREITFELGRPKRNKSKEEELKAHKMERKSVRRSTGQLLGNNKKKPVFWKGKKV